MNIITICSSSSTTIWVHDHLGTEHVKKPKKIQGNTRNLHYLTTENSESKSTIIRYGTIEKRNNQALRNHEQ